MKSSVSSLLLISFTAFAAAEAPCYPLVLNTVLGVNSTTFGNMIISDAIALAGNQIGNGGPNTNDPITTTNVTINNQESETLDISLTVTGNWDTDTQANFLLNAILAMSTSTTNMNVTMTPYWTSNGLGSYMNIYQGASYYAAKLTDSCGDDVALLQLSFDNLVPTQLLDGCDSAAEGVVTDLIWDFLTPLGGLPAGGLIAGFVTFACEIADGEF